MTWMLWLRDETASVARSSGAEIDGFDVVTVGIDQEGGVVIGTVIGADARLAAGLLDIL